MDFRSRNRQGDGTSNNPRQDSSPHRSHHSSLRHLGIERNTYDQQASTSSGLNNDNHDESQKRIKVLLDEYRICLNDKEKQNIILEVRKRVVQNANESILKQKVEELEDYMRKLQSGKYGDEEQVEIDKNLGYLLKNKDEKLRDIRMSVLKFIEQKINNESNKKEIFLYWSRAIDEYCVNHNQLVTNSVYTNVSKDMQLCYETNKYKRRTFRQKDNYKAQNRIVYKNIKSINRSLYTKQERQQLLRQEYQQQAEQELQDLLVQEQEILQQQPGLDDRQRTPGQRRELPNPEQRPIQRSQPIPEQRLAELMGEMTPLEITDYSEELLERVQRHRNPQERNEATLGQLRNEVQVLDQFLEYLNRPRASLPWHWDQPPEMVQAYLSRVRETIRQEFQEHDQQLRRDHRHEQPQPRPRTRIQRSWRQLLRILADRPPRQQ